MKPSQEVELLMQKINLLTKELGTVTPSAHFIAMKYMGMDSHDAVVRAIRTGKFPLQAFRMRDSTRAPYLVNVRNLAEYLLELQSEAA